MVNVTNGPGQTSDLTGWLEHKIAKARDWMVTGLQRAVIFCTGLVTLIIGLELVTQDTKLTARIAEAPVAFRPDRRPTQTLVTRVTQTLVTRGIGTSAVPLTRPIMPIRLGISWAQMFSLGAISRTMLPRHWADFDLL